MRWSVGRSVCFALALISAASCNVRKPQLSDEEFARLKASLPGMKQSCLEKIRLLGFGAMPTDIGACYEMEARRPWRGYWLNEFEGGQFCIKLERCQTHMKPEDATWLEFKASGSSQHKRPSYGMYSIAFFGRATRGYGAFGHMGAYRKAIVIDQLVELKPIGQRPSQRLD